MQTLCGHPVLAVGGGTGYAITRDDRVLCYGCADREERAAMKVAAVFVAYVSGDGRTITTWPGGTLARVTALWTGRAGFGGSMTYVNAITPDGARWHGKGAGPGMVIRLHRSAG